MKNSLSEREQSLVRKAYLIGHQDMFVELDWDKVYSIVDKAIDYDIEGGSTPEQTQAADAGVDPEATEGVTAAS